MWGPTAAKAQALASRTRWRGFRVSWRSACRAVLAEVPRATTLGDRVAPETSGFPSAAPPRVHLPRAFGEGDAMPSFICAACRAASASALSCIHTFTGLASNDAHQPLGALCEHPRGLDYT